MDRTQLVEGVVLATRDEGLSKVVCSAARRPAIVLCAASAVLASAIGCGDPPQVRGSVDFAVLPVGDFSFHLAGTDPSEAADPSRRRIVFRAFARASGLSAEADATAGPERVTGDLSFFSARAGLEIVEGEGGWESFYRVGLLGYGRERYDAVAGGAPETYRCEEGGVLGPAGIGLGAGLTRRLSRKHALTGEVYLSGALMFAEWSLRAEIRASRSVSILVGYTQYDQSCPAEDSSGSVVDLEFTMRCLATGVVCSF